MNKTNGASEVNTKSLEPLVENSIQSQNRRGGSFSLSNFLIRSGEIVSPWWSTQRDIELSAFVLQSDHFQGAIYKVISRLQSAKFLVEARDTTIKAHRKQAEFYNSILIEASEIGEGWQAWLSKFVYNLFTQDNGAFSEVIGRGDKDKEIEGFALGIAVLDSRRCTRTGDKIFPVVYQDTSGERFKLHHSRVIFTAQQPSPSVNMFGVGHCWVTRAINSTQNLIDMSIFQQEKLGSRPISQILIGSGIDADEIVGAILDAEQNMDNQGLKKWAKKVVIGSKNKDISIDIKDLVSADQFDQQASTMLGMFTIALSGGFPPRDFWPATGSGATKADAAFQHITGSSGYQSILDVVVFLLGGSPNVKQSMLKKFLPPSLKLTYDLLDNDADKTQADIKETRSKTWDIQLSNTMIDIRTAREQSLRAGDMTKSQFERLELLDGRLPNGDSALLLFLSNDSKFQSLLALPISRVLDVDFNKNRAEEVINIIDNQKVFVQGDIASAGRFGVLDKGRQALAALELLKKKYELVAPSPPNTPANPIAIDK